MKKIRGSFLVLVVIWAGCSVNPDTAGTYTTTEDSIAGVVLDTNGEPVEGVEVSLYDDTVIPTLKAGTQNILAIDTTNSLGEYRLDAEVSVPFILEYFKEYDTGYVLAARIEITEHAEGAELVPVTLTKVDAGAFELHGYDVLSLSSSSEDGESSMINSSSGSVNSSSVSLSSSEMDLYTDSVIIDTIQISSDNDDGVEKSNGIDLLNTVLELGSNNAGEEVWAGLLFRNVSTPKNAKIVSATIQFASAGPENVYSSYTIYGLSKSSGLDFTQATSIKNYSRLDTFAFWPDVIPWSASSLSDDEKTPDFFYLAQKIVDQPDWVAGNTMGIVLACVGKRLAMAHDNVPNRAPALIIHYRVLKSDL